MFSENIQELKEPIITCQYMLDKYPQFLNVNLDEGYSFENSDSLKLAPTMKFATIEDAQEITEIFKEVYQGTYPYKIMEDVDEVRNMIKSPNFNWVVFKLNFQELIGCVGFHFDFDNKKGYLFGFAFKKKYHGATDIITATIAGMVSILSRFKDKILIWYAEIRSSFTSIQYIAKVLGFRPISFLPNKDIFYNKNESEFLFVMYNEKTFTSLRSKDIPRIITPVINCYFHSFQKFGIGLPQVENYPQLYIDINATNYYEKRILKRVETDIYGNELITLSLKGKDSYIQFIHYPNIRIIEKTIFKISDIEELYVFVNEINLLIKKLKIRYFEVYLSAYDPIIQSIFNNAGFKPTGYVPAWNYNESTKLFEDEIVFVYYEKQLVNNIKLIGETSKFLKTTKQFKLLNKK